MHRQRNPIAIFPTRVFAVFVSALVALSVAGISASCTPPPAPQTSGENNEENNEENNGGNGENGNNNEPDAGHLDVADDTNPGDPDSGEPDTNGEEPEECSEICGDVNQDGQVTSSDLSALQPFIEGSQTPTACQQEWADVTGDGAIDLRDRYMVGVLIVGSATGGCTSCEQTCGDVNDNGEINTSDLTSFLNYSEGDETPSVCTFLAADVKGDGELDEGDSQAIIWVINELGLDGRCEVCERTCGDVNGDGEVTQADSLVVYDALAGDEPLATVCDRWAADIDGDGQISEADAEALVDIFASGSEGVGCAGGGELPASGPEITNFALNDEETDISLSAGDELHVEWDSSDADGCQAQGDFPGWAGTLSTSGEETLSIDAGQTPGDYSIGISCSGDTDQIERSVEIVDLCASRPPLSNYGNWQPASDIDYYDDPDPSVFAEVFHQPFPGTPNTLWFYLEEHRYASIEFTTPSQLNSSHQGQFNSENFGQSFEIGSEQRWVSITSCPGVFDLQHIEEPDCIAKRNATQEFRWVGPGHDNSEYFCELEPDKTYYLNIVYSENTVELDEFPPVQPDCGENACGHLLTHFSNL